MVMGICIWFFMTKQGTIFYSQILPEPTIVKVVTATSSDIQILPTSTTTLFRYIEITNGCGVSFEGVCVNMRSGASTSSPVIVRLRTGVVLKVKDTVVHDGIIWYRILFDQGLQYPERVLGDLFVADGDYLTVFTDEGLIREEQNHATTSKRIVVDISEEMLYAFDGDILFMKEPISTGLEFTPTPLGTFSVFKKTPTRYMQGPIPGSVSTQYYDLPGVPWDLYFTEGGSVIHGAYWHNRFGQPWSHGCVNLPPQKAKELYLWAPIGIHVIVQK
jgi:hypothetical protein